MKQFCILAALALSLSARAYAQPQGIRVSTWVREDLFAAFLVDDMDRFERGIQKLDEILKKNPSNASAIAWRAAGDCYLAVRAHEQGNDEEFERLYTKSLAALESVYTASPRHPSVLAVTAGATALFANRLPEPQRSESLELSLERYEELREFEGETFEQLPLHHRGEVLGGLAQAEELLGNRERSHAYLLRMIQKLPGTPYAAAAQEWLDDPTAVGKTSVTCLSCHEPGRLEAVSANGYR